jgi:hypothetical protein
MKRVYQITGRVLILYKGATAMENVLFVETIIQPKGSAYLWVIIAVLVILIAVMGSMAGFLFAPKNTTIAIKGNDIVIRSFIYGRTIPVSSVLIDEMRMINVHENGEFAVSVRTNGAGLPNFTSGWVRLKNGEKALVFITDKENVLYMPTKDFVVLFSMKRGAEFIQTLRGMEGN